MSKSHRAVEVAARVVGASIACGAAAYIFHEAGTPYQFTGALAAAGVIAGGMSSVTGLHSDLPKKYVAFRSIATVAASAWTFWACNAGPDFAPAGLLGLAGGMIAPYVGMVLATPKPAIDDVKRKLLRNPRETAWWIRIVKLAKVKLKSVDIVDWDNGHGYDVLGAFSEGGYTMESIARRLESFASDADLPIEGGVELRQGASRRDFILSVTTKDSLGNEAIPFPLETIGPRSVYDSATFGIFGNRDPMTFSDFRQKSLAIAGRNGAGKSGFLHNLVAHHAMCVDELVWIIDLNSNGKLAEQWLYEWEEKGFKGKPPIDAVAGTPEEAEFLVDFALEIAQSRSKAYRREIREAGDGDVPLSAEIPGIRIIIDEPKLIFGNYPRITAKLTDLQEIGRSCGIRPDWGILGATQKSLPIPIKDQVVHRVLMAVTEKTQAAYLFDSGWEVAHQIDMGRLNDSPGKAYVSAKGNGAVRLGRFYHIVMGAGKSMSQIAAFASTVRPDIDDAAKKLPGYAIYERRWDRYRKNLTGDDMPEREQESTPERAAKPRPADTTPIDPNTPAGRVHARFSRLLAEQESTPVTTKQSATPEPQVDDFESLMSGFAVDPVKIIVTEFIAAKGGYAQAGDIADAVSQETTPPLARSTVMGHLNSYVTDGWLVKPSRGVYALPPSSTEI